MRRYINGIPDEAGWYGDAHTPKRAGDLALPEALLGAYLDTMGFARLRVEGGTVRAVERNEEAYAAYFAAHPPEEARAEEPDAEALLLELAADHEARLCLLELGVN